MKIGKLIQQPSGYKAFIPGKFPPEEQIVLSDKIHQLHAKAVLMLGKLDGITQLLPDLDFFILDFNIHVVFDFGNRIHGSKRGMPPLI